MENNNKLYGDPRVIRFSNLACCTVVLASIPPAAFLRPQGAVFSSNFISQLLLFIFSTHLIPNSLQNIHDGVHR